MTIDQAASRLEEFADPDGAPWLAWGKWDAEALGIVLAAAQRERGASEAIARILADVDRGCIVATPDHACIICDPGATGAPVLDGFRCSIHAAAGK